MCLIAFAPRDRSQIPNGNLDRAHARNSDAWGLMFPEGGSLHTIREVSNHERFQRAWKGVPSHTPCAVHFRYATSGAKNPTMAHPFPLLQDEDGNVTLAVMHNGVLSCVDAVGELSDTAIFVRDVLLPQLCARPDLLELDGWRKAMGAIIGEDNKLFFMDGHGRVFLINGDQGHWQKGGVWYSNMYSIEAYKPVVNITRKLNDSWEDDIKRLYQIDDDVEFPDFSEMSETEVFNWVAEANLEDITDVIIQLSDNR